MQVYNSIKPPEELERILQQIRLLPRNVVLPDAMGIWNENLFEIVGTREFPKTKAVSYIRKIVNSKDAPIKTWEILVEIAPNLNYEKLIDLILEKFPAKEGFKETDWIYAFDQFYTNRQIIEYVVRAKEIAHFYERGSLDLPVSLNFSDDGKIEFRSNPLIELLQGRNSDRLRICPICDFIFWAYRNNQKWCSTKCKDVHFQRERRQDKRMRNAINERRRSVYAYKKSLKGEKKNGTL